MNSPGWRRGQAPPGVTVAETADPEGVDLNVIGFDHPSRFNPFISGLALGFLSTVAPLRTAALSPRLFTAVPFGEGAVDRATLYVQSQTCGTCWLPRSSRRCH